MKIFPLALGCCTLVFASLAVGEGLKHSPGRDQLPSRPAIIGSATVSRVPEPIVPACYPGSEPGLSCEAVAARAATVQARDASAQATLIWWEFGIGASTLMAAAAAALFAGIAAHHTKRSADIAQDASRAWVVCEDIKLRQEVTFDDVPGLGNRYFIEADIVLENVGNGIAQNVRVHVEAVSMESKYFEPAWASIRERTIVRFQAHAMPNRILGFKLNQRLETERVF